MALASVRAFRGLQEERVALYRDFEEGFSLYLASAPNFNFNIYKRLVHEITTEFNRISQLIICERQALSSVHEKEALAEIVDKIQEAESQKLELTAAFQIARQTLAEAGTTTTRSEAGDELDAEMRRREIADMKKRIGENAKKINELLDEFKFESEDLYIDLEDEHMSVDSR